MINIDNLTQIKQLDKENVAGSIEQLGLQCEQAFTESSNIKFPIEYKHVRNIIFSHFLCCLWVLFCFSGEIASG